MQSRKPPIPECEPKRRRWVAEPTAEKVKGAAAERYVELGGLHCVRSDFAHQLWRPGERLPLVLGTSESSAFRFRTRLYLAINLKSLAHRVHVPILRPPIRMLSAMN